MVHEVTRTQRRTRSKNCTGKPAEAGTVAPISHGFVSRRAKRIVGTRRRQAGCPDIGTLCAASVKVLAQDDADDEKDNRHE
jgi:hypothetical protein